MTGTSPGWDSWPPTDPTLARGFALWREGRLDDAEALFRDWSGTDEEGDAARGLGSVLWTRGQFVAARDAFALALQKAPWNAMHWANLGLALRDLSKGHSALMAFDMALSLAPDYEPAWNEKANVLYDFGLYENALPLYQHALSLNNRRAVVHHNLGMCLLALGDSVAALAAFHRALQLEPGYHYSLNMVQRLTNASPQ